MDGKLYTKVRISIELGDLGYFQVIALVGLWMDAAVFTAATRDKEVLSRRLAPVLETRYPINTCCCARRRGFSGRVLCTETHLPRY